MTIDWQKVPTPCYVLDEGILRANLATLADVRERTGCKILLALKGFAMFSVFGIVREFLQGACASSPHEARLAFEELGGEVHAYAPAYSEADVAELVRYADHITFNSFAQKRRFEPVVAAAGRPIRCGLRINPEHSEVAVAMYDPCAAHSRLGITRAQFQPEGLAGVSGLHFHTLCQQNADALARTLAAVEERFGEFFDRLEWINFGGGHHITRGDYDLDRLCGLIGRFGQRWPLQVYLEPGEAVALNAGVLVATVLDIVRNEMDIAILDASAAAHMPDVLEMPYRPEVLDAGPPGRYAHTYRLAGPTCLAGDVIGDYSFEEPLTVGSKVVLTDMAHYTMVKNTTFNGVQLPAIATYDPVADDLRVVRRFTYEDYRTRLS